MTDFIDVTERDMILFVGTYIPEQKEALVSLSKMLGKQVYPCVIIDSSDQKSIQGLAIDPNATIIYSDFKDPISIGEKLHKYKDRFIAVTCQAERTIPLFKKVIPHVPYISTPTELSLDWATDKIRMRQLLRQFDKDISPKFSVVSDASQDSIDKIEKRVGYPLILKPSGLAASLLVSICYHREDLENNLKSAVKKIQKIYKENKGRGDARILVEEFMEGRMYSIDVYVNQRGTAYFTPIVNIKTGYSVGYDDFFGYMRITPTLLKPHKIEAAKKATRQAVEALNLRSVTCHVELMKTEDGWKIIEVGPRIGGFRAAMYKLSYGIDHALNDILIRIPKKPKILKKVKGYSSVVQLYAYEKGRLKTITGANKIRKLESFNAVEINKKPGDMCNFARNGDRPVLTITLFSQNRSDILADIRRIEQTVKIIIEKTKQTKRSSGIDSDAGARTAGVQVE